jgi:hypothetical protein
VAPRRAWLECEAAGRGGGLGLERYSPVAWHTARLIPSDRQKMTASLAWWPTIPPQPFFKIIATALRPDYGRISSIEPHEFGG